MTTKTKSEKIPNQIPSGKDKDGQGKIFL